MKNKTSKSTKLNNRRAQPYELIYRGINYMPESFQTTLKYQKSFQMNNAAVSHANVRFTPTFCYDLDPTLGSTAMSGFAELQTIYRAYRLRNCTYRVSFVNSDTTPSTVCVCPVNFDPAANTASYQNYFSATRASIRLLASTGARPEVIRGELSIADFGGAVQGLYPDSYSGFGTTSPNNNIWLFVGADATGAGVLTNGVSVSLELFLTIDFFELAQPTV
jgi:hypothetical protein